MSNISEYLSSTRPQTASTYVAHKKLMAVNLDQDRKRMTKYAAFKKLLISWGEKVQQKNVATKFQNNKYLLQAILFSAAVLIEVFNAPIARASEPRPIIMADFVGDLQRALEKSARDAMNSGGASRVEQPPAKQPVPSSQNPEQTTSTPAQAREIRQAMRPSSANGGQETRTASGALLHIVACGGMYQGVAVAPPKSLDLKTSTPSNTYREADATGGIFPFVREAIEFFQSTCAQNPGREVRPPAHVWLSHSQTPAGGIDYGNPDRFVIVNMLSAPWSVRNGPADLANKEEAQRRQQVAAQEKQAQISAQRAQEKVQLAAFLRRHNAVEIPKMGILRSNPFSLEGKTIAIKVDFHRMTSPTVGSFEVLTHSLSDQGGQIIVSDIPRGTFLQPIRAFLAARVVGLNREGVPHLKYVGVAICSSPNAWCN